MPDESLVDRLLAIGPEIRYVALGSGQNVRMRQRSGLLDASSDESDRYEELLVNPTLLTLAGQRGDIDCGGLRYVIVAYGHFWQVVIPTGPRSHLSMAVERDADPVIAARSAFAIVAGSSPDNRGDASEDRS
jgi:hypothetical protein